MSCYGDSLTLRWRFGCHRFLYCVYVIIEWIICFTSFSDNNFICYKSWKTEAMNALPANTPTNSPASLYIIHHYTLCIMCPPTVFLLPQTNLFPGSKSHPLTPDKTLAPSIISSFFHIFNFFLSANSFSQ